MFDLVIGTKQKPGPVDTLVESVRALGLNEGTLYVGYPILTTADETVSVDALLTTPHHGVVVFDLQPPPAAAARTEFWNLLEEGQSRVDLALKSKLLRYPTLTERRELAVPVTVVTFFPRNAPAPPEQSLLRVSTPEDLGDLLNTLRPMDAARYPALNAAIQSVSTIRPRKKRSSVTRQESRGGRLREIEKEIANLDSWQKKGAIECPEGPQRIRGPAGSGKTVVLALKAAYLHALHPDWTIAVTFQTRSLYGQLQDLIRRFSYEHTNTEPDWSRLRVLHSWGTPREPGLYAVIAAAHGQPVLDFLTASGQHGRDAAFDGVCSALLETLKTRPVTALFDAVLIDEAQDFPPSFFRLVHAVLRDPRRLVWAYDELQNLSASQMPSLAELFGVREDGRPTVSLDAGADEPRRDVILRRCYRNTPWALATAHALAFRVFGGSPIQGFDDPTLWRDIGYRVVAGQLEPGTQVELERDPETVPSFFPSLLEPKDAVVVRSFSDDGAQTAWVTQEIVRNLKEDELEPSDILVVFPNPIKVFEKAGPIIAGLKRAGIEAHVAGVTRSRDEFFVEGSVVISGVFRAKGNEAPMVYVVDSQYCNPPIIDQTDGPPGLLAVQRRNMLFTAMTRARAWVRVSGVGPRMAALEKECRAVEQHEYRLSFRVPSVAELKTMRQMQRDRTPEERLRLKEQAEELSRMLEEGYSVSDLPPELVKRLRAHIDSSDQ